MSSLGWSHKGLIHIAQWPYTAAITVEEAEVLIQETFDEATEMLEVLNKYKKHLIDLKDKE
jgi:hypothetical protein